MTLHLLQLEDRAADAELAVRELQKAGITLTAQRVMTEADFLAALSAPELDLILADYSLPAYDGLSALAAARRERPTVPFIFVSGKLGEETAIEALHHGATDYVLKERLSRLVPAVRRALREVEERVRRERAQDHIRHLNQLLRAIRNINKLMTQERPLEDVLAEACRILVQTRGYSVVWVGLADPITQRATPVAYAGAGIDHLEAVPLTGDDSSMGEEPATMAMRSGTPWVCQELTTDPRCARLRERALARGYASLAAVPMRQGSRVFGAVTVYSERPETFPAEEVQLLTEVASDLALARQSLENENERARAETALRDSEQRHRSLFEHAPFGIFQTTVEGRIIRVNPALAHMFGYEQSSVMGGTTSDLATQFFVNPGQRHQIVRQALESDRFGQHEIEYRRRDGTVFTANMRIRGVRDGTGHVKFLEGFIEDVTKRQQAEAHLHLLREALESAANAIIITDRDGAIIWVNQAFTQLTGYAVEEVLGQNPRLLKSGVHNQEFYRNLWDTILAGKVWLGEITNRRKDGTLYTEESTITPVCDKFGNITHFIAIKPDISGRKQAEEALRQSEEYFRALTEHAMDITTVLDPDGTIRYASPSLERVLGYTPTQVVGRKCFRVVHPEEEARLRQVFSHAVAVRGWTGRTEFRVRHKDGSWRNLESVARNLIANPDVKGVVVNSRDVTERKRLETQLRQAQKIEAIGTLAGGIAHDFNNILGAILANVGLLKMDLPQSHPTQTLIDEIEKASHRAADLVRQILTFSRQQEQPRQSMPLQPIVNEALRLLRATIPATVEVRTDIWPDCPPALIDPTQVHQVLLNLCTNAYQALPEHKGWLQVSLKVADVGRDLVTRHPGLRVGRYVLLTVRDNGCGMDTATIDRIFEPFYTTKPVGEGTGLGLSVVHGIVNNHEGVITVRSQPGHGTTFDVYFPAYAAKPTDAAPRPAPIPHGSGERILLVEDEAALGRSTERVLAQLGYQVTLRDTAAAAIDIFVNESQPFELVLLDLSLPGMNGLEVAHRFFETRPDQLILLVTGFSGRLSAADVRKLGIADLLLKPFNPRTLGEVVFRLLHQTPIKSA